MNIILSRYNGGPWWIGIALRALWPDGHSRLHPRRKWVQPLRPILAGGWSGKCRKTPRVIETEPRLDGRTQSSGAMPTRLAVYDGTNDGLCRPTDKQTRG